MGTSDCAIFGSSFAITVATILGTGILGLPVKLAFSGLFPFIVCFVIVLFAQLAVVWLMVDLLQVVHKDIL